MNASVRGCAAVRGQCASAPQLSSAVRVRGALRSSTAPAHSLRTHCKRTNQDQCASARTKGTPQMKDDLSPAIDYIWCAEANR